MKGILLNMNQPIYFPFADGQWRLSMGLKPLKEEDWIEIDDHFIHELSLKQQLFTQQYEDVFASLPDSLAGQQEVLALLLDYLPKRYPEIYQVTEKTIKNLATGEVWYIWDFANNPLDLAGRLVQEDLLLLLPNEDNNYCLVAGSLCFPLRWKIQEKLGRSLAAIHDPVPGYQHQLEKPVDHFFERLKENYPVWRLNWGLVDTPELFVPPEKSTNQLNIPLTVDNAGDVLWLRVERQTLRRLPKTNGVLFTIKTYIYPLNILEDKPEISQGLVLTLQQMPETTQLYKNIAPVREVVLQYLQQI